MKIQASSILGHIELKTSTQINNGKVDFHSQAIHFDRNGTCIKTSDKIKSPFSLKWSDDSPITELDLKKLSS